MRWRNKVLFALSQQKRERYADNVVGNVVCATEKQS